MPEKQQPNWQSRVGQSLFDLVSQLKRCDEFGITTAAVAMAFICIDTLANLSRPPDKAKVTRSDFKEWVDTYLKGHEGQPYHYRGKDVYAARCALLHKYGAEAELHEEDPDTIPFVYHNGGKHKYKPDVQPRLVTIGPTSLINDVVIGVESFLEACQNDPALKALVESRLGEVLVRVPFPNG